MVKFLKYIYTNKIKNKVELVLHFKFVDKGSTWQIVVVNSQINHQGRLNYITTAFTFAPDPWCSFSELSTGLHNV